MRIAPNQWFVVLATVASACLIVSVGCGGDETPLVPVSGTVTFDGEPLANARVNFEPRAKPGATVAGPGSFGRTDAQGRFELATMEDRSGAVVATHRVTISTYLAERGEDGNAVVLSKEVLPDRYHAASEMTFDVPVGGTDAATFDLTSK